MKGLKACDVKCRRDFAVAPEAQVVAEGETGSDLAHVEMPPAACCLRQLHHITASDGVANAKVAASAIRVACKPQCDSNPAHGLIDDVKAPTSMFSSFPASVADCEGRAMGNQTHDSCWGCFGAAFGGFLQVHAVLADCVFPAFPSEGFVSVCGIATIIAETIRRFSS